MDNLYFILVCSVFGEMQLGSFVCFFLQNFGVQFLVFLVLVVMFENFSSRDVVGKLGKIVVVNNEEEYLVF